MGGARGYTLTGTLPDGKPGMTYQARYAAVGGFYFPGFAGYTEPTAQNASRALAPTEFGNWLLTQFATLDEVRAGLDQVVIVPTTPPGWGVLPTFHFIVYDASGKSLVIEPIAGTFQVHDNPLGVITNSPDFGWHMTNLSNYVNLSPIAAAPQDIDGVKVQAFSTGSGLRGMPGDFTSPSRFVRAAIFSSTARSVKTADEGVFEVFHLLNQFDIPRGAVVTPEPGAATQVEWTLATVARDPVGLNYYVRTYDDPTIRRIALPDFALDAKDIAYLSLAGRSGFVTIPASAATTTPAR